MNFPTQLLRGNRKEKPQERILLFHYAFVRHKPGHDWKDEDELPDFTKIKIEDQSCYWDQYSIPIWARFNDVKEYKEDYAVVAYKVSTIRQTSKVLRIKKYTKVEFDDLTLNIRHLPIDTNYSHCEMSSIVLNKTERREIRMTLKHNSKVYLKPNEKRNLILLQLDYYKMLSFRWISALICFLTGSLFSGLSKKVK